MVTCARKGTVISNLVGYRKAKSTAERKEIKTHLMSLVTCGKTGEITDNPAGRSGEKKEWGLWGILRL